MDKRVDRLPLSEKGKQSLMQVLVLLRHAQEAVQCLSCGSIFETLPQEILEDLSRAVPGPIDFDDVDYFCGSCVASQITDK